MRILSLLIPILLISLFFPHTITLTTEEPKFEIVVEEIGWREITAYSSTEDQTDDTPFITASQTEVRDGIVACPRYYPFGTKFLIGDRVYICEDRMHKDYQHRFDIWFPNREMARAWGKQILIVKVIKEL